MTLHEIEKYGYRVYVDIKHPNYKLFVQDLTNNGYLWMSGTEIARKNINKTYYKLHVLAKRITWEELEESNDPIITLDEYEESTIEEVDLSALI